MKFGIVVCECMEYVCVFGQIDIFEIFGPVARVGSVAKVGTVAKVGPVAKPLMQIKSQTH